MVQTVSVLLHFLDMPLLVLLKLQVVLHEPINAHYVLGLVQKVVFFFSVEVFLNLGVDLLQLLLALLDEDVLAEFVLGLVEEGAAGAYLFLFCNAGNRDASLPLHLVKYFLQVLDIAIQL